MAVRIKVGDTVQVICGSDKGRRGRVLRKKGCDWLLVEGVCLKHKHVKGDPNAQKPGGIIKKEAFIHISNVILVDTESGEQGKVAFKFLENGQKVRYFRASGTTILDPKVV